MFIFPRVQAVDVAPTESGALRQTRHVVALRKSPRNYFTWNVDTSQKAIARSFTGFSAARGRPLSRADLPLPHRNLSYAVQPSAGSASSSRRIRSASSSSYASPAHVHVLHIAASCHPSLTPRSAHHGRRRTSQLPSLKPATTLNTTNATNQQPATNSLMQTQQRNENNNWLHNFVQQQLAAELIAAARVLAAS